MIEKGTLYPLLDKGFLRYRDSMGVDLDIAKCARISYNGDVGRDILENRDVRLIERLLNDNHTSPFEHCIISFEVKAPIFVFRQWLRHRFFSYSEMSYRYKKAESGFYEPSKNDITCQSKDNKQMRTEVVIEDNETVAKEIYKAYTFSNKVYDFIIGMGCPRELARIILPCGAYSRMIATGSLHNWMHFLNLRLEEDAQTEIRVYAVKILEVLKDLFPTTINQFLKIRKKNKLVKILDKKGFFNKNTNLTYEQYIDCMNTINKGD